MANRLGILTALVLAVAAFVAFKNKKQYENVIATTQTEKQSLTTSNARLTADRVVLDALPIERTGVDEEVNQLVTDEATAKKANEVLQADADAKTAKIAANKGKLDEIRENEKMGDIDELASKVRTMNAHILELDSSIEGNSSKLSNLTAQDSSTQSQIAAAKTKFENFSGSQSLPNLTTRIRSIYPNWGFVTLAAGNSSGVVTNSTLNVVRGGEVIAKLLVTAVEGSSSSASIVPNSIGEDVTLTVGDQVVPGVKETTPAGN